MCDRSQDSELDDFFAVLREHWAEAEGTIATSDGYEDGEEPTSMPDESDVSDPPVRTGEEPEGEVEPTTNPENSTDKAEPTKPPSMPGSSDSVEALTSSGNSELITPPPREKAKNSPDSMPPPPPPPKKALMNTLPKGPATSAHHALVKKRIEELELLAGFVSAVHGFYFLKSVRLLTSW